MQGIAALLQNRTLAPQDKNERRYILKQLDAIHHSEHERILRKKANWSRYIAYLKTVKQKDSEENRAIFKKGKTFLKEYKSLWYFLSHVPTKDLYAALSVAKDKMNRGENASAYLIGLNRVK